MKRTIIHGLIAGLSSSLLVACGGTTDSGTSASSSKYLADGEACNAAWVASTAYNGGAKVSRSGRNYTAAYWTQNQDPVTNSGPAGSGQPWIPGYLCGSTPTPTPTPAPTPTPTPAPTPTPTPAPTPTPTPAPTPTPTPAPTPTPTPAPTPTGTCPQYVSGHAYATGDKVTNVGNYYQCTVGGWCSQGGAYDPGTGWAWQNAWSQIAASQCGGTPTPTPTPAPTPTPTPTPAPTPTPTPAPTPTPTPTPTPAGFAFGPYKDVTVSLNWNTNVMSTNVTGTLSPVTSVMPAKLSTVTWAFATGECGSEVWGGVQGAAMASANVQPFVSAGKKYILSTGGAAGSFTCGSDSGFSTFINRYNSSNLLGVDFDIEAGQSQAVIDSLVQRVKNAQGAHPNLRFSFTLATLGGNSPQSLGSIGVTTMNSIKAAGLTNYYIDLMVMDYGTANSSNCTLNASGKCDMAQSAIQAAINLHNYWGVPYNRIELTPMIGGNDAQDEVFTLANVDTMTSWAKANGIAGIHYWSLDRDVDCAPGYASPICNSYGQAGTWGFANRFIADLGL